jgi:hypothetical protein
MPKKSNNTDPAGCAVLAALLAVGIPLAWLCFLVWAIYTVVTWLTSK